MAETEHGGAPENEPRRRRWRPGVTTLILAGLVLGVAAGVVFGDLMGGLAVPGRVFIALTQITVFPYIVLGLIHGVGSLDASVAKRLATRGVPVLVLFWAVSIAVFYVIPLAFPERTVASFYDPNRFPGAGGDAGIDWVTYIPANPFQSLASGMVPAIVIFSLCVGIALIGAARKQGFLDGIAFVNGLLGRINRVIILCGSPLGVFAIVSSTVGTMDLEQVRGVGVYLASYTVATLLIVLVVLPLAAIAFTGVTYRQLVTAFKAPALLAFTTGNAFIALPMIAAGARDLLRKRGAPKEQAWEIADTLTPLAFALPLAGTLGALLFVIFASWFDGSVLTVVDYVSMTASGLLSLFGEPRLAIQMLLDQMGLPAEATNLYIATEQLLRNLTVLVGVLSMGIFVFSAGAAVLGAWRLRLRRTLVTALVAAVAVAGGAAALQVALRPLGTSGEAGYETLQKMRLPFSMPTRVYTSLAEAPAPPRGPAGADLLTRVQARGVLRVGYAPKAFPFSYTNGDGDLVGFDVERVYSLAQLLESRRIDFIAVDRQDYAPQLESGFVDLVVGAIEVTPSQYTLVDFTSVYMTLRIAVVAPDVQADDYRTEESLARLRGRRFAVEKGSYYARLLRAANPNFTVVEIDDSLDFFEGGVADALFTSAEEGSAYTLMHPHYEVVVPEFPQPPLYLAYPVPKGEVQWVLFLDNWLIMEKESGSQQTEYDYWITGKTAVQKQPRWSVVRNVLGWWK